MKLLRHILAAGAVGMALTLAMGSAPAARAAGLTYYVNDTVANDPTPTTCPATTYTNLQALVTALNTAGTKTNVTIYVCPGRYLAASNVVTFNGYTNLKLLGKTTGALMWGDGLGTDFITVENSSKVTVSNLDFIGLGTLGSGRATAIHYLNSTGTISKNLIDAWHQDYDSTLTTIDVGFEVDTTTAAQKVVIDHNSLYDVQTYGILVFGPGKAVVTSNYIQFRNDIFQPAPMPPGPGIQAAILLLEAGPGVSVSKNRIDGNTGIEPKCGASCVVLDNDSRGIMLLQTSGASVKGNTVNYAQQGISIESWCASIVSTSGEQLADNNLISGNILNDDGNAVQILANDYFSSSTCSAQADHNSVKGNKISVDVYGTNRVKVSATLPDTAAGDIVTGNSFYSFLTPTVPIQSIGSGVTGLISEPNKLLPLPMGVH